MNFFLIVGFIGFVLLMVSMFSGHDGDLSVDHDVGHPDVDDSISIFSFRTIMTFMTAFGGIGWLCLYFEKSMLFSSFAGGVAGLVFGFVAWWITNFAMKQQVSSLLNGRDLIGKNAVVHTTIPRGGVGEVQVEFAGQRKYFPAQSDGEISSGVIVYINDYVSGTLIVSASKSNNI